MCQFVRMGIVITPVTIFSNSTAQLSGVKSKNEWLTSIVIALASGVDVVI